MDVLEAREEGRRIKEQTLRKITESLPRDIAIVALWEAGFKQYEIADVYGITAVRVGQILKKVA